MTTPNVPTREIGYAQVPIMSTSGTSSAQWWMYEDETTPELRWPQSVFVYDQMRRQDSQVVSVLRAVTLPVRRTPWRIDPAGARDEVVQLVAEDLGLPIVGREPKPMNRTGDRFSWTDHLREALLMLPFGHCVDQETEALTQRGWLRQRDLRQGDMLLTLNPETGLSEWQPCERVHRYEGTFPVRRLDGRSHSSVTTLNHRWITRDHNSGKLRFRTTEELTTGDRILRAAPSADLPTEAKWSDAFVELVAWYWTEGHEHVGGGAALWQSETVNASKCQRIRAALTTLFGPARISLPHGRGREVACWREETRIGGVSKGRITYWYLNKVAAAELRSVAPRRIVSPGFVASLTSAQLRLFVETSVDADGSRTAGTNRNSVVLSQKDGARLDAFEMACTLLGVPWSRNPRANGHATSIGKQAEIRPVYAARRGDGRMTDTLEVVHNGVWCPQVANRTWFARRRGTAYFTGNSYFEQVYRIVDGLARLRKLSVRMPKTIEEITVARDGGLISVTQYALGGGVSETPIPVSRLVAYIHEGESGNWLGTSLLRPAYKNWLLKDRLLRVQAQTIERNGMGIPTYEAAPNERDLSKGLALATSLRAGEAAGAAIPAEAKLKLMGVEGQLPDAEPAIRYHDEQIGRAVLAHFLNLGTQTGSWALGSTFADFFTLSLQTLAQQIADVVTQHVVEDLVDLNFGEDEPAPKVVFDEIGSRQAATAEAIKSLIDAGVITPDEVLESAVRQQFGLPPADPATAAPPPTQAAPSPAPEPEPSPGEGSVAASASVTAKFNPAQRRDDDGKWTDSPGDLDMDLDGEEDGDSAPTVAISKSVRAAGRDVVAFDDPDGEHIKGGGRGVAFPFGEGQLKDSEAIGSAVVLPAADAPHVASALERLGKTPKPGSSASGVGPVVFAEEDAAGFHLAAFHDVDGDLYGEDKVFVAMSTVRGQHLPVSDILDRGESVTVSPGQARSLAKALRELAGEPVRAASKPARHSATGTEASMAALLDRALRIIAEFEKPSRRAGRPVRANRKRGYGSVGKALATLRSLRGRLSGSLRRELDQIIASLAGLKTGAAPVTAHATHNQKDHGRRRTGTLGSVLDKLESLREKLGDDDKSTLDRAMDQLRGLESSDVDDDDLIEDEPEDEDEPDDDEDAMTMDSGSGELTFTPYDDGDIDVDWDGGGLRFTPQEAREAVSAVTEFGALPVVEVPETPASPDWVKTQEQYQTWYKEWTESGAWSEYNAVVGEKTLSGGELKIIRQGSGVFLIGYPDEVDAVAAGVDQLGVLQLDEVDEGRQFVELMQAALAATGVKASHARPQRRKAVIAHLPGKHPQDRHGRHGRKKSLTDVLKADVPKPARKKAAPKAKPEKVAAPKAPARKRAAPKAKTTSKAEESSARLRAGIASGTAYERKISGENNMNHVYLTQFNDGSRAVVKVPKGTGDDIKAEFDAEELGAHIARALNLSPPHVHRADEEEVYFSYLHDTMPNAKVGAQVGIENSVIGSLDAKRIGLLDTLIENTDRNKGNWFVENPDDPGARLIPIDHGQGWEPARSGGDPADIPYPQPFQRYLFQSSPRSAWIDNDLSPKYLATLRPKLEALRPEFDRLGRGEWLDRVFTRLDIVTAHAKGTVML